jgi:ribosome-interacting GTPase 1
VHRWQRVALTKFDDADSEAVERFGGAFPGLSVVTTSILDEASLARLKASAWQLTGVIRVYVRDGGDPFALPKGSTVLDVAAAIHSALMREFRGARVWGPSARFAGQRVGRDHVVLEGDTVEVLTA